MKKSNIIAIMSGKGGVGKSTTGVMIAKILEENNKKVLLIDLDICGPSIPTLLKSKDPIKYEGGSLLPVKFTENFSFISFGNMLNEKDVVIWRGVKKRLVLENIINKVLMNKNDYDYILIDTPPGLSEEHLLLINYHISIILLTSSQNLSLSDAQSTIFFAQENSIPILGVIQTFTKVDCPNCLKHIFPYGKNGGMLLASKYNLKLLCELNVDVDVYNLTELGKFFQEINKTESYSILENPIKQLFDFDSE